MQSAFLGVLMALFGNGLIGLSFSVMKVAHQQNRGGGSYLRIPLWWAGNALVISGPCTIHAFSYAAGSCLLKRACQRQMGMGELGNLVAYSLVPLIPHPPPPLPSLHCQRL
jgi:hypothetical protein